MKFIRKGLLDVACIAMWWMATPGCANPGKTVTMGGLSNTSWISRSYLDALDRAGMPASVRQFKCLELVFNAAADSVMVIEGLLHARAYPVRATSDSTFIATGLQEGGYFGHRPGSRRLSFVADSVEVMFGPLDKKYMVGQVRGWRSGAGLFFNERLIAARYLLLNPDDEPTVPVTFSAYGEVSGLANYKAYRVCLHESCFAGGADVVELSDGSTSDRFIWEWKRDTMRFYNIRVTGREVQELKRGQEIFRFIKQR